MNSKVLKILVAIISLLGIAGFIMVARAEEDTPGMTSAVDFMVNVAYFLLIATVVVAVLLSLWSLIKNPAALKKTLLGLLVLGVVLLISYFLSSDAAVSGANGESLLAQGSTSKWSGTGLIFSYILLAFGGVFFIWDLLKSLVKS